MRSLEPLEQLAVDAFTTAVDVCRDEGIDLPQKVWAIAQSPEKYVSELGDTAKQHPGLNAAYRTARKLLRKLEGDRKKRMSTDDRVFSGRFASPLEQSTNPVSTQESPATPSTSSNRHRTSGRAENSDSTHSDSTATSPSTPIRPVVYRYTLPDTASPQAEIAFSKQVEMIRRSNPDWVVSFDRPNPGESDAIILIHKDEHYATTHAAYVMNQTLNRVVGPALSRIFGATSSKLPKPS